MNNLSSIFRSFFVETYFIQLNAFNQYYTCIKYTIIFKALLETSVIVYPWPLGVGQVWQFSFNTWRSRHRDVTWLAQSNLGLQPNQAALFSLLFPHLLTLALEKWQSPSENTGHPICPERQGSQRRKLGTQRGVKRMVSAVCGPLKTLLLEGEWGWHGITLFSQAHLPHTSPLRMIICYLREVYKDEGNYCINSEKIEWNI